MSEEEKDILVTKRKYWTKLMKYNLAGTLFLPFVFIVTRMLFHADVGVFPDAAPESIITLIVILMFVGITYLAFAWPLSLIMYGYQIYKITKPKVLAKSSEMSLRSTQKHNGAMGEDEITRLKSIADLRDSGVLTDDEFQEQKSRILAESTGAASNQTHFTGEGEPLMKGKGNSIGTVGAVLIVVGILFTCAIIGSLFSGGSDIVGEDYDCSGPYVCTNCYKNGEFWLNSGAVYTCGFYLNYDNPTIGWDFQIYESEGENTSVNIYMMNETNYNKTQGPSKDLAITELSVFDLNLAPEERFSIEGTQINFDKNELVYFLIESQTKIRFFFNVERLENQV